MDTILYKGMMWIQTYEGIYTLIILHCIGWICWIVKDGIMSKEHLK